MLNNISIDLIKTFNEDEIKKFKDFLNSPFFNKRKELVRLYEIIIKCRPGYDNAVLKRGNLFKKLYPESSYSEQTLKTRMTELTSLIRVYFSVYHVQQNPLMQKQFQAKELMKRQKYSMSEKLFKDIYETVSKEKTSGLKYFEDNYSVLTDLCEIYSVAENYKEKLNSEIARAESLINFFLISLFNSSSNIISINVHSKEGEDSELIYKFLENLSINIYLEYLKKTNNKHYAIISIYYYTYLTRKENDNEEHFYKLKEAIYNNYKKFTKAEQHNFWNFLSNAIYPSLFKKDRKFYKEKHDIDKFFNKLNVFKIIDNKYLFVQTYNNIYSAAVLANELDWAEKFVIENKNNLLPEFRENTFNYCMATLNFKKNKFEKSITYLSKVHFHELTYNLDVRVCYIMNYYELNMYDQLTAAIDAFKHFITENKRLPEHRTEWADTSLKFISKITNAKFGNKKLDYADYKEAESNQSFMSRRWILEKMKELI